MTTKEWFSFLPDGVRERAINNSLWGTDWEAASIGSALLVSFDWPDTPEGYDFWWTIYDICSSGSDDVFEKIAEFYGSRKCTEDLVWRQAAQ
jgi:hypothetical protein